MRYPILIEKADQSHAYGVVVPDLPGCFSAADTLDEVHDKAKEAIELWLEGALDSGDPIPAPSSLDAVAALPDYQGWFPSVVDVDLSAVTDDVKRINITLPARVLRRLDALAKKANETRSGYIARRIALASPN